MSRRITVYDTTLRDGTQGEMINFSAEDKVRIARRLDEMGFHYIEGGWPGSNPKDHRFFQMAKSILLEHAKLTAFGSTRRPRTRLEDDDNIQSLMTSETPVVAIFGKSWDLHVLEVLGTELDENCSMISDTVSFFKERDREVVYDAEHFFDGYLRNPDYAMRTLDAAVHAGVDVIVLCDTNGGALPQQISEIVRDVRSENSNSTGNSCSQRQRPGRCQQPGSGYGRCLDGPGYIKRVMASDAETRI